MYEQYMKQRIIEDIILKISYYSYMGKLSVCPCVKIYFIHLKELEEKNLEILIGRNYRKDNSTVQSLQREKVFTKVFTIEELSQYNGEGDRPAYVAVNGIVYDVSMNTAWGGGTHFGLYSGKDLTGEFVGCHKGDVEILNGLPKVGIIKNN